MTGLVLYLSWLDYKLTWSYIMIFDQLSLYCQDNWRGGEGSQNIQTSQLCIKSYYMLYQNVLKLLSVKYSEDVLANQQVVNGISSSIPLGGAYNIKVF